MFLGDTILQAAGNASQAATAQHGTVPGADFPAHEPPHVLLHAHIVLLHHVARERKDCPAGGEAHAPRGGAHRFGQPFQPLRPILRGRLELPGLVVVAVGGVAVAEHQFVGTPLLRRAGFQVPRLTGLPRLTGVALRVWMSDGDHSIFRFTGLRPSLELQAIGRNYFPGLSGQFSPALHLLRNRFRQQGAVPVHRCALPAPRWCAAARPCPGFAPCL